MGNKEYIIKIDGDGNISFRFDPMCNDIYGKPISATSNTTVEIMPAEDKKPAMLVKTTTIKESYPLKQREIKKEDLDFAINLVTMQHSKLTINFQYIDDLLTPDIYAKMIITKIKGEEAYKVQLLFEFDQYFDGEIQSKKIKDTASFKLNKEGIFQMHEAFARNKTIKESISLLQSIKSVMSEALIDEYTKPQSSVKEILKEQVKSVNKPIKTNKQERTTDDGLH